MTDETDYLDSHLTEPGHDFDLVAGLTGRALDATLRLLFDKAERPFGVIWLTAGADGAFAEAPPAAGIDPFAVFGKDEAAAAKAKAALSGAGCTLVVRAWLGVPTLPDKSKSAEPMLSLGRDPDRAAFSALFASFEAMRLGADGSWTRHVQAPEAPVKVRYRAALSLGAVAMDHGFDDAEDAARAVLRKRLEDGLYDVRALQLQLQTDRPLEAPVLPGCEGAEMLLAEGFVAGLLGRMAPGGRLVLGYAAHRSDGGAAGSIAPNSLDLAISPHLDAQGKEDADPGLTTVVYLSNTGGRAPGMPGGFPWNWVSRAQADTVHGAMAVRREVFGRHLAACLSPVAGRLCIAPDTHMDVNLTTWYASLKLANRPRGLDYHPGGGEVVAAMNFKARDFSEDRWGFKRGWFGATCTAAARVHVAGDQIRIHLTAGMSVDISGGDGWLDIVDGPLVAYGLEVS